MAPDLFFEQYIKNWSPTPLDQIGGIWFKQERFNPSGSIKDRGLAWQVYELLRQGHWQAVISSSGNAALAAAYYSDRVGIQLVIFVGRGIESEKLGRLRATSAQVAQVDDPMRQAEEYARAHSVVLLRQSLDEKATRGFQGLARELCNQLDSRGVRVSETSIFLAVSSATTLVGLFEGFHGDLGQGSLVDGETAVPQLHAVQSEAVHPIASVFDRDFRRKSRSIVKGVSARSTARAPVAVDAVRATHGSGWVVPDQEVELAHGWIVQRGLVSSREGALALAGYWKAARSDFRLLKNVLVILS